MIFNDRTSRWVDIDKTDKVHKDKTFDTPITKIIKKIKQPS